MVHTKARRRDLRISQTRLASLAGVSRYKIALYELGDGELTADELGRIDAAILKEAARLRNALDRLERPAPVGAVGQA